VAFPESKKGIRIMLAADLQQRLADLAQRIALLRGYL